MGISKQRTAYRAPLEPGKEWITLLQLQVFFSSRWYYSHRSTQTTDLSGLTLEGSASDAQIYNESELKEKLEKVTLGLPDPDVLPTDNEPTPYYFIADDAFGMREQLLKPYPIRGLTRDERIFNYRLSRARRAVGNAFGILANRFGIMHTTMFHHPAHVRVIIQACLMLHNLMRTRFQDIQEGLVDREMADHRLVPGEWRHGRNMLDVHAPRGHNVANLAGKRLRHIVKHLCNSPAGSVAWQERMVT